VSEPISARGFPSSGNLSGTEKKMTAATANGLSNNVALRPVPESHPRSFPATAKGSELLIVVSASVLLLVPCFWLPQIESFDLCSQIYNAWLARMISQQQITGFWIAHQSTNILVDNLLTLFMSWFGPALAQRILVSLSVLLFFWSSFKLVAVLSNRRPWFLLPCVAMLSYGRIFHYGFFNFYVSLACAFLALSLLWKRSSGRYILFVLTLLLSWAAHPLPALAALGAAAYISIGRNASRRIQLTLWGSTAVLVLAIGVYQRVSFPRSVGPNLGLARTLLAVPGWGQVRVFDHAFSLLSYRTIELGILLAFLIFLVQVLRREKGSAFSVPMQLCSLTCLAGFVLPARAFHLSAAFRVPLGFIAERISLAAAVLGCGAVARANPRPWQRWLLLSLAGIFFVAIYRDERALTQLENKVDQLVSQLPPMQRVAALLHYDGAEDGFTENIVDRACLGRCYSYGNYEAPTSQFRVRANPNNPYILADYGDSTRLAQGLYRVQARDLPLHQIYPCGPGITDLCMRDLKVGELNGGILLGHP
jgi:hypothetical protein